MRSTISFQDGNWQKIVSKYGDVMWLKVKDKFKQCDTLRDDRFQAFVISTMQRLFRSWKSRLYTHYSRYSTNEERLSHRPDDVALEDCKYLVQYFGSQDFKVVSERNKKNRLKLMTKHSCGPRSFAEVEELTRDPLSGEKDTPDKVWEIQHTRVTNMGEVMWSDPKSQNIHVQLKQLVDQQQSEENEHPMSRDEILSFVLGERSGYVRGKGYGKKSLKKSHMNQANIDACVSSTLDIVRQKLEVDMDRKMQEEREQMAAELQKKLEEERAEMQKKFEEEREQLTGELDRRIQQQLAAFMSSMQQGQLLNKDFNLG